MPSRQTSRGALESALAGQGLRVLGGWIPGADDGLPALAQGRAPAVVWLVGQVGSECWQAFAASPFYSDGQPDPLDRWSKAIGNRLAAQCDGVAIYPSDGPPYYPFQQWAARCEALQTSPLMLQIHPRYGLWHAYRFALVAPELLPDDALDLVARRPMPTDLCGSCAGQPCLHACPVQAFTGTSYRVDECAAHLHRPQGQDCMQAGCLARVACPVGADYRYARAHAAFHMAAFAQRR